MKLICKISSMKLKCKISYLILVTWNILPHISDITSNKSRLIGPQSHAWELLWQYLGDSSLLGVQQIYSHDGLAIQRHWMHSLRPTENVPAAPLNTRKGWKGIFQFNSSSDVDAMEVMGVSVGSGIFVGVWGAMAEDEGVTNEGWIKGHPINMMK